MKTSSSAASSTRDFPYAFPVISKCEFGFCRKGLSWDLDLQLAVGACPVYNPARRYLRPGCAEASPGVPVLVRRSFSEGA